MPETAVAVISTQALEMPQQSGRRFERTRVVSNWLNPNYVSASLMLWIQNAAERERDTVQNKPKRIGGLITRLGIVGLSTYLSTKAIPPLKFGDTSNNHPSSLPGTQKYINNR